jgi:hypothetical protein
MDGVEDAWGMGNIATKTNSPNNLPRYRNYDPHLEPDQELELIRRAQSHDQRAGAELHKRFNAKIVAVVRRLMTKLSLPWDGELFEDLVAAGHEALCKSVSRFDTNSGYRLWTFARKPVGGGIVDEAARYCGPRRRGSRIARWIGAHIDATPGELLEAQTTTLKLKRPPFYSLEAAALALKAAAAARITAAKEQSCTSLPVEPSPPIAPIQRRAQRRKATQEQR